MPVNRSSTTLWPNARETISATSAAISSSIDGSGKTQHPHAADGDSAAQQPAAGHVVVDPQQLLADPLRVRIEDAVPDVIAQCAEVGDVVVQPFELQQDRPDALRRNGNSRPRRRPPRPGRRARAWPTEVSPLTRSASSSARCRECRPSKSFSMPRCTNQSRAFRFSTVSPTTENRKCPGPIMPACTGPTGISYTPGPSTLRNGERAVDVAERWGVAGGRPHRVPAAGPVEVPHHPAGHRVVVGDDAEQVADLALEPAGGEGERGEAGNVRPGTVRRRAAVRPAGRCRPG